MAAPSSSSFPYTKGKERLGLETLCCLSLHSHPRHTFGTIKVEVADVDGFPGELNEFGV
jgi:hypothetical protein